MILVLLHTFYSIKGYIISLFLHFDTRSGQEPFSDVSPMDSPLLPDIEAPKGNKFTYKGPF
jgi:hypothetical protein